ncbi:hypothetical protein [Bacillus sp. J33]|uniref:hypothetical protein n=1 Tax=Bacillus sp. J33 TaxID=935836 RepID=UPI00047AF640|nr:hypothetical protein [Bacillus sp. J33]
MDANRIKEFDQIVKTGKEVQKALNEYWMEYALYTSFEYWLLVALLVVPLIILFFKIDKSKIFFMGFYGYSIHMLFSHIDSFAKHSGFLNYPFPLVPMLPGIALDSSFIPVTFMLVYQWTINHKKNYYLYMGLASAVLAFVFKPFLAAVGLFRLYGNTNFFHIFVVYLIIILAAKLITNVFLWTERKFKHTNDSG